MLRNCALIVAMPLSCEALQAARARSDGSDLAAQLGDWERYRPLAELALATIEDARQAGVSVTTEATLPAWAGALGRFQVVTLVAHWRSSSIRPSDIQRWDVLLEAVTDSTSPLWAAVRRCHHAMAPPKAFDLATLSAWLNQALDAPAPGPQPVSLEAKLVERESVRHTRRCAIEQSLPGVFTGGAAVEFGDGFKLVRDILPVLNPAMSCTLDLTVCNSVLLGQEIRRTCRECVVMLNARPASPAFRLALYRQVIQLMKRSRRSYIDTTMELRRHLLDHVTS